MSPGLTIDKWGPAAWNTLHVAAHSYPREPTPAQRANMRAYLELFAQHLPCPSCRRHFEALLRDRLDDRALASRASLVAFLNGAHNDVNRRLGKREWSLQEHYEVYRVRRGISPVDALPLLFATSALVVAVCCALHRRRGCNQNRAIKQNQFAHQKPAARR